MDPIEYIEYLDKSSPNEEQDWNDDDWSSWPDSAEEYDKDQYKD